MLYSSELHPLRLQVVAFGNRQKVSRGIKSLLATSLRNVFFSLPFGPVVRIRFFYHRGLGLIPAQGMTCFWGNTWHESKTWYNCWKSYTLLSQRPKNCCNLENSLLLYQHSFQRSTSEDFFSQGKIFACQAHVKVHCCQKKIVSHKKKYNPLSRIWTSDLRITAISPTVLRSTNWAIKGGQL